VAWWLDTGSSPYE